MTQKHTYLDAAPVAADDGLAAIVVPFDTDRGYVIELRELIGTDTNICEEGVLVYHVDTATSMRPLMPEGRKRDEPAAATCGSSVFYTLSNRPDSPSRVSDYRERLSVEVEDSSLGAYRVTVTVKSGR